MDGIVATVLLCRMANRSRRAHPLLNTLRESRGNQRACILTEPLWGIPFNLFTPYLSVYMLALGVGDRGIGLVTSVGLVVQVLTALLGGPITDKLGRKRATLIFDILSWSIPTLIWAFAQDIRWFLLAAVTHALLRIPMTSWTCLLVEDAPDEQLVNIWSLILIAGIISGFVAPVAGFLVSRFSLVPTVRGLFLFAFVMMTTKFIVLNVFAEETTQGEKRRVQTRGVSMFRLIGQYMGVLRGIIRNRGTVAAVGVMLAYMVYRSVRNAFWPVLLTEGLQFTPESLSWLHALRSAVMLACYFFVLPRINHQRVKESLLAGFGMTSVGMALLVLAPVRSLATVIAATVLESVGVAVAGPFLEALLVRAVDPQERARILALAGVFVIAVTSPFGWIAGALSEIGKSLPFVMLLGALAAGMGAIVAYRAPQQK